MFALRQRSARFVSARYRFILFGLTQSGITCGIAAAIATATFSPHSAFVGPWLRSWLLSWLTMVPVVVLASPFIKRLVDSVTQDSER
jgi:hypothetical protein